MRTHLLGFLALALLVVALASGNPFLRASKPLRGGPAARTPAPAEPAPVLRAQPASLSSSMPATLTIGPVPGSARLPRLVDGGPDPAAVEREFAGPDGVTLWLLRDGRVVRLAAGREALELVSAQAMPHFEPLPEQPR